MRFLPQTPTIVAAVVSCFHDVLGSAAVRSAVSPASRRGRDQHDQHDHQHRRLSSFDPTKINEDQPKLLAWQELLTNGSTDWEWVLVRVNGVVDLENADWVWFGEADPVITITAEGENLVEPPVEFHNDASMSKYVFTALVGTDKARWYEIGMVAYAKGTAASVNVLLSDVDALTMEQTLIQQSIDLATTVPVSLFDQWVDVELKDTNGEYMLNISLWRSETPIKTKEDQDNMDLTEILFDLNDGNVASLVYKTDPSFDQAVLYFPGRSDSFAHPHVLDMYQSLGYDFYSLDPRYCGRTRRYMNDTFYGHWIDDFDKYQEEIDLTMEYMAKNKEYSKVVAHVHSTGALVALNYVMQVQKDGGDDPFDAYILNGPFLDWGIVGGDLNEFILENSGIADFFGMTNPSEATGISAWHTRNWILYRYNVSERQIIQAHVNADWAQAVTKVQGNIASSKNPITKRPALLIASLGDDVVVAKESEDRMPHVSSNYSTVILTNNAHDVTLSYTETLDEDALAEISTWLSTGETLGTHANTASSAARYALVTSRLAAYLTIGFFWKLLF